MNFDALSQQKKNVSNRDTRLTYSLGNTFKIDKKTREQSGLFHFSTFYELGIHSAP